MRGRHLALALCLGLLGCASGFKTVVHAPPGELHCTTVFVYPFNFIGGGESEARSFSLSQRLLDAALRSEGDVFAFYGPSEFRLLKPEVPGLWASSTALPVLMKAGSRPDQGLLLRASAEKRVLVSAQQTQDAKGAAKGSQSMEETTWVGRVEIFHPSSAVTLVEVEGEVTVSPFDEPPPEADFDPAPALTRLMARLVRTALGKVERYAADREVGPEVDATLAVTPRSVLQAGTGSVGAAAELARMDPLDADLFLTNEARFLSPWMTDRDASKLKEAPPGLAVMAAPAGAKVQPGDVITSIDGEPALPQVLARQRFTGVPVQAQVRAADGSTREVILP